MTFDAAYREGYVAGVTAHVEHSRCQRCYDAGQARVAALTAALAQIREQRCCDHCPAIAEAALDATGGA